MELANNCLPQCKSAEDGGTHTLHHQELPPRAPAQYEDKVQGMLLLVQACSEA